MFRNNHLWTISVMKHSIDQLFWMAYHELWIQQKAVHFLPTSTQILFHCHPDMPMLSKFKPTPTMNTKSNWCSSCYLFYILSPLKAIQAISSQVSEQILARPVYAGSVSDDIRTHQYKSPVYVILAQSLHGILSSCIAYTSITFFHNSLLWSTEYLGNALFTFH